MVEQAGVHGQEDQTDYNQNDGKARAIVSVVHAVDAAGRTVFVSLLATFFSGKVL